jgi:hypothetical protein
MDESVWMKKDEDEKKYCLGWVQEVPYGSTEGIDFC